MLTEVEKLWLQIFRSKNIGPVTFSQLFKKYTAEESIHFLKSKGILLASKEVIDLEIAKTIEFGAKILFFKNPQYPKILLNYRDSPPFLIVKGRTKLLNNRCVSIVGSRNSSLHGNKVARDFARFLSQKGYTVVSGMARGIDSSAHTGAILDIGSVVKNSSDKKLNDMISSQSENNSGPNYKKHGSTIALLAGGIDNIYPFENTELYYKIASEGLLVSENPIGTVPAAMYFHSRNRIVASISEAIVLVEATKNSGSLITAQYALDYGKEICCIPGSPLDPRSYGPNNLIKNGANLIQNTEDLLEILEQSSKNESFFKEADSQILEPCNQEGSRAGRSKTHYDSHDIKRDLLFSLSLIPIEIEQLSHGLNCPIHIVRQNLIELELEGSIRHLPGDLVSLVTHK